MGRGAQPALVASPALAMVEPVPSVAVPDKRVEPSFIVLRNQHLREVNNLKHKLTKIKRLVKQLEGVNSIGQFMAVFQELKVLAVAKGW